MKKTMGTLLILAGLISSAANAKDKNSDKILNSSLSSTVGKKTLEQEKPKDGFQPVDMNQFQELKEKPKSKVKNISSCKNRAGIEFSDKDPGYSSCMSEAAADQATKRENGASSTTGIRFGD